MGRRRSGREGDINDVADEAFFSPLLPPTPLADTLLSDFGRTPAPLSIIEDRRLFNPDPLRSPSLISGRRAHRVVVSPSPGKTLSPFVKFAEPQRVLVCVRRKQRKEVLHALRKTGRGAGRRRRPRRNFYSDVGC